MFDSTVCDIYLIDETGTLKGRPILTTCIDAYSSMCYGYVLSWNNDTKSLCHLLQNILTDKTEWCGKFGIPLDKSQWNVQELPGIFVTDMGREYTSECFAQITETGVTMVNLPPYRPELKGADAMDGYGGTDSKSEYQTVSGFRKGLPELRERGLC